MGVVVDKVHMQVFRISVCILGYPVTITAEAGIGRRDREKPLDAGESNGEVEVASAWCDLVARLRFHIGAGKGLTITMGSMQGLTCFNLLT